MTNDIGRSPDGSGSRASHEAAKASSPKASIPNAEEFCLCGEPVAENGYFCGDCWNVENGQFGVGA